MPARWNAVTAVIGTWAEAVDAVVDNPINVDAEKKESKTVANIMKPSTTDVLRSITTTKTCATPMDGTSPMVTPAQLADSPIKIMSLMQSPTIQKEHADCTNFYLTRHEDVGRGIV